MRIADRPKRLRRHGAPVTAPVLEFIGGTPFANAVHAKHVIRFSDPMGRVGSTSKPAGARSLELFYDLVPFGEPIPTWPGERWGGRTWYLRSFTRSPMTVAYPKTSEPMRVVYWGRWASATGEPGPWSATLATRVEGIDRAMLNAPFARGADQTIIITSGVKQLPAVSAVEPPDLVDVNRIDDERRMLPDETAEAA
jgi:hypothetical protein